MSGDEKIYGLLAEFDSVGCLLESADRVYNEGYTEWEIYSPFPVHRADQMKRDKPTRLPWIVLAGGLTGMALGFLLSWWTSATMVEGLPTALQGYPWVVSGKPLFSLPANVPIIFELTILFSALSAVVGMFALNRLPRYHHPLFAKECFRRVTQDRFFIAIEATDPKFDLNKTGSFLRSLPATLIESVHEEE